MVTDMPSQIDTRAIVLTIAFTVAAIIVLIVSALVSKRKNKGQAPDASQAEPAGQPTADEETIGKLEAAKRAALKAAAYSSTAWSGICFLASFPPEGTCSSGKALLGCGLTMNRYSPWWSSP